MYTWVLRGCSATRSAANLRTKILDLRGLDSSIIWFVRRWNSQARREFPGKLESRHLSRETLGMEIGRTPLLLQLLLSILVLLLLLLLLLSLVITIIVIIVITIIMIIQHSSRRLRGGTAAGEAAGLVLGCCFMWLCAMLLCACAKCGSARAFLRPEVTRACAC